MNLIIPYLILSGIVPVMCLVAALIFPFLMTPSFFVIAMIMALYMRASFDLGQI